MVNKHLMDLVAEFPRLKRFEIAEALGVPNSTFCHWTNRNEVNRSVAPEWTKNIIQVAREKLNDKSIKRFGSTVVQPVTQPTTNTDPLFLVSVPAAKVNSFRGLVVMVGGNIVDM